MNAPASYAVRSERDVLARVSALHTNPPFIVHQRADLRFVALHYSTGELTYPAISYYAISTRLGGAAYIRDEGWRSGVLPAPPGAVFIHAPNRVVRYGCRQEHLVRAVCIEPEEVQRGALETERPNPDRIELISRVEHDFVSVRLLAAFAAEAELGAHPGQALAGGALRKAMIMHMLDHYAVIAPRTADRCEPGLSPQALKTAIEYLEYHRAGGCNLDELATELGVSSFVLARQFRRATGESPARYLLRTRIERAKVLLAQRGQTPARVASALGFSDRPAFQRLFQRFTGVTPASFALLHGADLRWFPAHVGRPS